VNRTESPSPSRPKTPLRVLLARSANKTPHSTKSSGRKRSDSGSSSSSDRPPWRAGNFDDYRRYYKFNESQESDTSDTPRSKFSESGMRQDAAIGNKLQLKAKKVRLFSNVFLIPTSDYFR
jgi:hypothetical protein